MASESCDLLNGNFKRRFGEGIKRIGSGAEGLVQKVRDKMDHKEYAVKIIDVDREGTRTLSELLKGAFGPPHKEAVRLAHVGSHPNIVGYFGAWFEKVSPSDCEQPSTIQVLPPNTAANLSLPGGIVTDAEVSAVGSSLMAALEVGLRAVDENNAVELDEVTTNKSLPSIYLYIQLELCTTSLNDWLTERLTFMNSLNLSYEPKFSQILRWVKKPNPQQAVANLCLLVEDEETNSCLEGIVRGLNRMHSKGYAHGDLHSGNILIQIDEHGLVVPKLSDFGLAKTLEQLESQLTQAKSDEIGIKTDPNSVAKDCKSDMQQLAEIIEELYHPDRSKVEQFDTFVKCFPQQAKWIEQLKADDFNLRPTAVNILREGLKMKIFNSRDLENEILKAENLRLRQQADEKQTSAKVQLGMTTLSP